MPPSEKPKVIEYLWNRVQSGDFPDWIIRSDDIVDAIEATDAKLSTKNPANFLKDIIRHDNASATWPESLRTQGITARQRYGSTRVFQFHEYANGQSEPFPNRFFPTPATPQHLMQTASMSFVARQLGRSEETWITQIAVYLRLIETQLCIFSPMQQRVRDVTHLQMRMKTQPEIDAVYVASFGQDETMESQTSLYLLVTCEAKEIGQRILEDQIKEQVAKAMEVTGIVETPNINGVKPMAVKVVNFPFNTGLERGIYVVEFQHIMRSAFEDLWRPTSEDDERLYEMPLERVSEAIYRLVPPIGGVNG